MTPAEFEDRLHELLDARADPLADPACVSFLADHPDRLEAFAQLQERCAALPVVAPRSDVPPRRLPPWLLVAAAAAAVVALLLLVRGSPAAAAPSPVGRVLAADLHPIPSLLQPTARVGARTVLLAEPTAHLELFTRWSPP